MSIVHLDPQKLSATNFHVVKVHLSTSVASLKQLQKQCLWMNNALYLQSAQTLWQIASIQKKLFAIDCYVKESGAMYESLERCLHAQAKMLSNASNKNTAQYQYSKAKGRVPCAGHLAQGPSLAGAAPASSSFPKPAARRNNFRSKNFLQIYPFPGESKKSD